MNVAGKDAMAHPLVSSRIIRIGDSDTQRHPRWLHEVVAAVAPVIAAATGWVTATTIDVYGGVHIR